MDKTDHGNPAPPELPDAKKLDAENMRLRGEIIRLQSTVGTLLQKEEERTAREADNKRRLQELEMLATKDQITGLLNRLGFEEAMTRYMSYVARTLEHGNKNPNPATFVYIDFDRFKPINDLFGHHVGNIILMKIGRCFKQILRENDYVARLSGDEFAILLKNVGDRETAVTVIEKLRQAVRQITIDGASEEQLEIFYASIGRRNPLEFSAGYFVVKNAQLDARQIEDIAENDVPKFSALRPKRGEYTVP